MTSPRPALVFARFATAEHIRRASTARPHAVIVNLIPVGSDGRVTPGRRSSTRGWLLARRGVVMEMPRAVHLLVTGVIANPMLSHDLFTDVMWGADPDGGPEDLPLTRGQYTPHAVTVLAALGFDLVTRHGRGWEAAPLDLASAPAA